MELSVKQKQEQIHGEKYEPVSNTLDKFFCQSLATGG